MTETYSIRCHVAECQNLEEDSRGFCGQHLKRFISGQVYENESGDMVDHCAQDHELTGENVRWESAGKGKRRRRCRECLRAKARRQTANALPVVELYKPYRPQDETLTSAIDDFEEAQKVVPAKCKDNPGPYMDWDEAPSSEEAKRLCSGCALAKACLNFGIAGKMPDGIWGGRVVVAGVWQ